MTALTYDYDPYVKSEEDGSGEHEIPCFRIYQHGTELTVVAETNEDLPSETQERYARLFASAPQLLDALEYFFNIMHDYESSLRKGYIKQALKMAREAIEEAKGGRR
jgi:hypothetical protein